MTTDTAKTTEMTPAEHIAEAIAEDQPCTCGEAGRCPRCTFDTEGAAKIIDRKLIDRKLAGAIVGQLHKAIRHLGGMSDILTITGSFQDTLEDSEVLQFLQNWNNGVRPVCICSVDETSLRQTPLRLTPE